MKPLATFLICFLLSSLIEAQEREFYRHPAWEPRVTMPAEDVLRGKFWPASPKVEVDYSAPGFAEERLSKIPPPGVHPRVFLSPEDIDEIRAKVAIGDAAPGVFRKFWGEQQKNRTAFYALVSQNNELGLELAAQFVESANELTKKHNEMLALSGIERDNLWATGPGPERLVDYDYLHQWLTPEQRSLVRGAIAQITQGRSSNFLEVPDHFMINNHLCFGMQQMIPSLLAIEEEEGFDPAVYNLAAHKLRAMLTYYFSPDGMAYETIKCWLPTHVLLAVGRRERDLLKHGRLLAKMRYQTQALRWEDGRWKIREEMTNSAMHVNMLMRRFYPEDPTIDFLYKATLTTHRLDDESDFKGFRTVGCSGDVLCYLADSGMVDENGQALSYDNQDAIDILDLPNFWHCPQRGYMIARNSWRKDDMKVSVFGKQDFIYNGHEGPEQGRFLLWKDGVNWAADLSMLFNKTCADQNMVTVNGKGSTWPPVSGMWLGTIETPLSATSILDYKDGYSYVKVAQVHPFLAPEVATPRFKGWDNGNFTFTRDMQLPFHDVVVEFMDGYGHTDYGTWNGETRVTEYYRDWNPVETAFRTVHLAKGKYPYLLFFDDIRKDHAEHLYEWNMTVPGDVEMMSYNSFDSFGTTVTDIVLGKIDTARKAEFRYSGVRELNYSPKNGDPAMLVRVLQRNSSYERPSPRFERYGNWPLNKICVPAITKTPEFKVLLYPHKHGEARPKVEWNRGNSALTIEFPEQKDVYRFAKTDGGRTVFAQERNGGFVTKSQSPPRAR